MNPTLFVRELTCIDFARYCPDKGVIGESYFIDFEITGLVDSHSQMIFDFSPLKKRVKSTIDHFFDHRFFCPQKFFSAKEGTGFFEHKNRKYQAPLCAFYLSEHESWSDNILKLELEKIVQSDEELKNFKISLTPRIESFSEPNIYHYTHGLFRHNGMCQRLFHGHRNTIRVLIDEKRNVQAENDLIQEIFGPFRSKHLVWDRHISESFENTYTIKYQSEEGFFYAGLPKSEVVVVPIETTIENLSLFFAKKVKKKYPDHKVKVFAFEGINKGSSCEL